MKGTESPDRMLELIGISALIMATASYVFAIYSSDLVATYGRVTSTQVREYQDISKPLTRDQLKLTSLPVDGSCTHIRRYCVVNYTYYSGGKYHSAQFQSEALANREPDRIANSFPSGKAVTIFVSRSDPSQTSLWRNSNSTDGFLIFLGVAGYVLAYLCRRFEFVSHFFGGMNAEASLNQAAT